MENTFKIISAKYGASPETGENISVKIVTDDASMLVPLDPANRHYAEIMRQVEAGELTIEDAE